QINWSRSGYVPMRIEIVSDTVTSSPASTIRTEINQRLFQVRDTLIRPVVRTALTSQTGSPLRVAAYNAAQALDDSAALLKAYATLAVPFEIDVSDVLKSAFRGNPARSELGLGATAVLGLVNLWDDLDSANLDDPGNRSQSEREIRSTLDARVDAVNAEIQRAIAARPLEGSGYVEWMLAEARALRDHASRLAVDDTFASSELATANVLRNDVRQRSTPGATRGLEVDLSFGPGSAGYLAPTAGVVLMRADGTFVFTPSNPDFVGTQTFSYRARCNIAAPAASPVWVTSLPAYVRLEISDQGCPADINGDGGVDGDDVIAFFTAWDNANPAADFNGDNAVDGDDVIAFFERWDGGC
ncbi:MAG: GC-type dockerin domain-anchored protein, partial [Phycisphaerales bacterium]